MFNRKNDPVLCDSHNALIWRKTCKRKTWSLQIPFTCIQLLIRMKIFNGSHKVFPGFGFLFDYYCLRERFSVAFNLNSTYSNRMWPCPTRFSLGDNFWSLQPDIRSYESSWSLKHKTLTGLKGNICSYSKFFACLVCATLPCSWESWDGKSGHTLQKYGFLLICLVDLITS